MLSVDYVWTYPFWPYPLRLESDVCDTNAVDLYSNVRLAIVVVSESQLFDLLKLFLTTLHLRSCGVKILQIPCVPNFTYSSVISDSSFTSLFWCWKSLFLCARTWKA
jgi:hypothetical protein